jgi:hypothetical protein
VNNYQSDQFIILLKQQQHMWAEYNGMAIGRSSNIVTSQSYVAYTRINHRWKRSLIIYSTLKKSTAVGKSRASRMSRTSSTKVLALLTLHPQHSFACIRLQLRNWSRNIPWRFRLSQWVLFEGTGVWDLTPCSIITLFRRFGRMCCVCLPLISNLLDKKCILTTLGAPQPELGTIHAIVLYNGHVSYSQRILLPLEQNPVTMTTGVPHCSGKSEQVYTLYKPRDIQLN